MDAPLSDDDAPLGSGSKVITADPIGSESGPLHGSCRIKADGKPNSNGSVIGYRTRLIEVNGHHTCKTIPHGINSMMGIPRTKGSNIEREHLLGHFKNAISMVNGKDNH